VEFGDERFDIPTDSPPHRRDRGDFYLNFGNHQDRESVLTIWCFGKGGSSWSVDDERIKDFDYKLLEVRYDKVPGYLMNYRDGDRYITGITYDGIDLDGEGPDTGGCSIEYHITKREE